MIKEDFGYYCQKPSKEFLRSAKTQLQKLMKRQTKILNDNLFSLTHAQSGDLVILKSRLYSNQPFNLELVVVIASNSNRIAVSWRAATVYFNPIDGRLAFFPNSDLLIQALTPSLLDAFIISNGEKEKPKKISEGDKVIEIEDVKVGDKVFEVGGKTPGATRREAVVTKATKHRLTLKSSLGTTIYNRDTGWEVNGDAFWVKHIVPFNSMDNQAQKTKMLKDIRKAVNGVEAESWSFEKCQAIFNAIKD